MNYNRFKSQLEGVPADKLPADRRFDPLALNPYVLFKALPQVKKYRPDELIRAMDLLLRCNQRLVSSGLDEALVCSRLWCRLSRRSRSRHEVQELKKQRWQPAPIDHLAPYGCLVFSSDGKRVAADSSGTELKIWDAFSGRELLVKDMKNQVTALAFSPDDKHLAVACRNSDMQFLDAGTGELA